MLPWFPLLVVRCPAWLAADFVVGETRFGVSLGFLLLRVSSPFDTTLDLVAVGEKDVARQERAQYDRGCKTSDIVLISFVVDGNERFTKRTSKREDPDEARVVEP